MSLNRVRGGQVGAGLARAISTLSECLFVLTQGPDRQPGRDRRPGHPHLPRARHRHAWPCTRTWTATPFTSVWPTRPTPSAARPPRRAISTPRRSSTPSPARAPTGSIPGTGSSPRMRTSPGPSPTPGWPGSALRPRRSRSWATRSAPASRPNGRTSSACPGTTEVLTSADEVVAFGEANGWPVAIKAAYGGGGRGMRVVQQASEAAAALESAQREAEKAFGRSESYLERYLTWPRHVEVQVFVDTPRGRRVPGYPGLLGAAPPPEAHRGGARPGHPGRHPRRHGRRGGQGGQGLRVRQRRHRRVHLPGRRVLLPRDEHPAPGRTPRHRGDRGEDLVALQLRIAAGEPLGFTQEDVRITGHAIEVRINAEDPAGGTLPALPGHDQPVPRPDGYGVRTDAGYDEGDTVSQFYDNLIAKVDRVGPRS